MPDTALTQQTPTTALAVSPQRARLADMLELAVNQLSDSDVAALLGGGNLGVLKKEVQQAFIAYRAKQLGLDPLSNPFILIATDGKVKLYATKECAEMLRATRHVSVVDQKVEFIKELVVVHVKLRVPDSACENGFREEWNMGAEHIGIASGEGQAKAIMKAQSKALRRGTLAITGSGLSDSDDSSGAAGFRQSPYRPPVQAEAAPPPAIFDVEVQAVEPPSV